MNTRDAVVSAQGLDAARTRPARTAMDAWRRGRSTFRVEAGRFAAAAPSALRAAQASSSAAPRRPAFVARPAATRRSAGTGMASSGSPAGGPVRSGPIKRLELLPEQPLRPSVGDKVMKLDHQRMVVVHRAAAAGHAAAAPFNVEGLAAATSVPAFDRRRSPAPGTRSEVRRSSRGTAVPTVCSGSPTPSREKVDLSTSWRSQIVAMLASKASRSSGPDSRATSRT